MATDEDGEGGAGARRDAMVRMLLRAIAVLAAALVLIATGYAWSGVHRVRAGLTTTGALDAVPPVAPVAPPASEGPASEDPASPSPTSESPASDSPTDDGTTDVLLVGIDRRTDAQGRPLPAAVLRDLHTEFDPGVRTDTIILLRVPDRGGPATAVSIPRDTWVQPPGQPPSKINAVYGAAFAASKLARSTAAEEEVQRQADEAGRAALVRAVEQLSGVRVDHYAEIGLYGFALLTQAIGGVPVCLRHPVSDKDSGADFPAGPQVLSGGAALSFVRQRAGLPDGDLGRIRRQQAFLAAAAHQILSAGTLASPSTLDALVDTARRSLVLDDGWDVLDFAAQLPRLTDGTVRFVTIPVLTIDGRSPDGQSIVVVDPDQVRRFVRGLVAASTAIPPAPQLSEAPPAPEFPEAPEVPVTSDATPPASTPDGSATPGHSPITADGVVCVD